MLPCRASPTPLHPPTASFPPKLTHPPSLKVQHSFGEDAAVSRYPRVAASSILAQQRQSTQRLAMCCCTVDAMGRLLLQFPFRRRQIFPNMLLQTHSDSNPTSTRLQPRPQRRGLHSTLPSALCPCSDVQAMRRAHLLDGAVSS